MPQNICPVPWKKLNDLDDLPKDGYPFLAMIGHRVAIVQYHIHTGYFWFCTDPAFNIPSTEIPMERLSLIDYYLEIKFCLPSSEPYESEKKS